MYDHSFIVDGQSAHRRRVRQLEKYSLGIVINLTNENEDCF